MLHFAGGNSHSFVFLTNIISKIFEVHTLELPGRGKRFNEVLIKNSEEAIDDYVNQIKNKRNDKPFIIYGHSMGATLGIFVAKKLEELSDMPKALVLTGSVGIGVKDVEEENKGKRYLMNETDFKQELRDLGGVSEEVLENEELYSFFNPQIRADFEVIEQGLPIENIVIQSPIYAFMGTEENCSDRVENWKRFTTSYCNCEVWKGNHFFIHDHSEALVRIFEKSFD